MHEKEYNPRERLTATFLADRTPDFIAPSITSISPAFTRERGLKGLFLDVEGTFVAQGQLEPDRATVEHLDRLRHDGGVEHIVLVTNKRVKNPATFVTLAHWGRMSGAAMVMSPLDGSWRKPRPRMITEAAGRLGLDPQEVLMAGDKLTADVRAANAAGVTSAWVPEPFGGKDMIGDRVFRRPYEKLLAQQMNIATLSYDGAAEYQRSVSEEFQRSGIFDNIDWWERKIPDELLSVANNLYGFGIEHNREVHGHVLGSRWLYENGGEVADLLSESRPLLKAAGAVLERSHPKLAAMIKASGSATDMADGWIAKRSKRGATRDGGRKDELNDKVGRTVSEIGMVLTGSLHLRHLVDRSVADVAMNWFRGEHVGRGGDGSAVLPGKLATILVEVANIATPILAQKHPLIAASLNEFATDAKIARVPANLHFMEKRAEERARVAPQLSSLAEQLALASF